MKEHASHYDSMDRRSFLPAYYSSLIARHSSVITRRLLIFWFALSPLASFYLRYPAERSLITFDRLILALAAGLILFKWYNQTRSDGLHQSIVATKFEITWLLLAVVAVLSASGMSNNFGTAAKTAIDAFLLPLLVFRLARYHLDLGDERRLLLIAAMFLGFAFFITGAYEMVTGANLFAYQGSAIVREGEIRVNGPFSSDSSYAGISLLITLFLLAAPKILRVKMDGSAQFIYLCSLGAALASCLLPVFRTIALALALCWAGFEVLKRWGRESKADSKFNASEKMPLKSGNALILAGVFLIAILTCGVIFISLLSADRLTSFYNVYGRLATWTAAVKIVAENLTTGVGLNNYRDYIDLKYQTADQLEDAVGEIRAARSPHSNLLWIAAELGICGLALYLAANVFIFLPGYRMLRNSRTAQQRIASACYLALAAAYTMVGLTLTSGAYSDLNLYFFFLLGLLSREARYRTES